MADICNHRHCQAVVDAGSTGSRLHLYAYDTDAQDAPIHVDELWAKKIEPGLASVEPTADHINAYLNQLFSNATGQHIPLYFYSTGGMRLLSQPKQQRYYHAINEWFASQSQWSLKDAKTITGREEGLFGWLAINYQLGTLQSPTEPLLNVMDMGGASVQVSFPVTTTYGINPDDLIQVDLYNRHIQLFIHSFLGLGQTEVSHQYSDMKHCFPNDYPLPNGSLGQGDAFSCQADVTGLINTVHHVRTLIEPAIKNNPELSWYAISGLSALAQSEPFHFDQNQLTNQDLLDQAHHQLCQATWETLLTQYPDNHYIHTNCLTASYYYALMVDGYGIQPEQTIHYLPKTEAPDWTLGAILSKPHTTTT